MFRLRRLLATLAILCFGLPLFLGLGRTDLANDEAIYSYAVDRILETGNWLTPESIPQTSSPGDPSRRPPRSFFEKPPLKFWIVAAPIYLGLLPHDEWGLRFWDAVFGAAAFTYLFLIGRRLVDPVCGVVAVLFLVVHGPLLLQHGLRGNVMEAALVLEYCGGVYHFLAWSAEQRLSRRRLHSLAVAGWFAFGFLIKFVAALFLPLILGACALLVAEWRGRVWRERRRWLAAALLSLLLIAPWFAWQHQRVGLELWDMMLGSHVVQRFTGSLDPAHLHAWHYYLSELWRKLNRSDTALWVCGGSLLWLSQCLWRRWSGGVLVLLWLTLPVALITMGSSKLYHYLYPFLPAAALMGAYPASVLVRLARGLPSGLSAPDSVFWSRWLSRAGALASPLFQRRSTRGLLAVVAIGAFAVALVTLLHGPIALEGPGAVRFRSSSLLRPCVIGLLCLVPLCPARSRALALALALFLGPLARYVSVVDRMATTRRPMGATRDCVLEQSRKGERAALRPRSSAIFVHLPPGEGLTHNYYYYYRHLGTWERPAEPDDALLYARLFAPGQRAPTLILEEDYLAFRRRMGSPDLREELADRAKGDDDRSLAPDPPSPPAAITGIRLGGDGTSAALLLLPGAYEVCARRAVAEGGELFRDSSGG